MICPKCGTYLKDDFIICPACGTPVDVQAKQGKEPASDMPDAPAGPPPSPYETLEHDSKPASENIDGASEPASAQPAMKPQGKSRVVAGVLGILLGGLGIHKFYLGYATPGFIMLGIWILGLLFSCIPTWGVAIVGIIEGITYLTKSDQEFYDTYVAHTREWF